MPIYHVPLSLVVEVLAENEQDAYQEAVNRFMLNRQLKLEGRLLVAELDRKDPEEDFAGVFSIKMKSRIRKVLINGQIIAVYLTPKEAYMPALDIIAGRRNLRDEMLKRDW